MPFWKSGPDGTSPVKKELSRTAGLPAGASDLRGFFEFGEGRESV